MAATEDVDRINTKDGATGAATKNSFTDYSKLLGVDLEQGHKSLYSRVQKDYQVHTAQYWFVACLANGLLWLQIILGAALTALSASPASNTKTPSIYLGVATTVVAGFLTYFKSRNQPNRARQFRQALRNVRNKIEQSADEMQTVSDPAVAQRKYHEIIKLYDDALNEAAANYPDLWVTMSDLKGFFRSQPGQVPSESTSGKVENSTAASVPEKTQMSSTALGSSDIRPQMAESQTESQGYRSGSPVVPALPPLDQPMKRHAKETSNTIDAATTSSPTGQLGNENIVIPVTKLSLTPDVFTEEDNKRTKDHNTKDTITPINNGLLDSQSDHKLSTHKQPTTGGNIPESSSQASAARAANDLIQQNVGFLLLR